MIFYKRNKHNEKKQWHIWFAWYPVIVAINPDGYYRVAWWQKVYRRIEETNWGYDTYREYFYKEFIKK